MDSEFFTGYRTNVVRPEEVLLSIKLPFSKKVSETFGEALLLYLFQFPNYVGLKK